MEVLAIPCPTKALQWPSVSFLEVCVAFQYASVMGGLLIMLFSAFVCTGGPIQHCIDRQVLMDIEQIQYPQLHHASCRIPADWLLLLKNWGPWPTCDRSKNNYAGPPCGTTSQPRSSRSHPNIISLSLSHLYFRCVFI